MNFFTLFHLAETWHLHTEPPFFISFLYPLPSSPSFFPNSLSCTLHRWYCPKNVWSSLSRWSGPWTSRRSIRPLHLRSFSSGMWKRRRRTCLSNIHIIPVWRIFTDIFLPPCFFLLFFPPRSLFPSSSPPPLSFSLHLLPLHLLLLLPQVHLATWVVQHNV